MAILPKTPAAALDLLSRRLFSHIEVSPGWVEAVRSAAERGAVVHVLRSESFIDVLALDYLVRRFGLPPLRFAQDTRLGALDPLGEGWLEGFLQRELTVQQRIERAIGGGGSAVLFLKRPPSALADGTAARALGKSEGDEALRALIELQRHQGRPVVLIPQTFIWSRRPDTRGADVFDALFGSREYPGALRTISQFLLNYRNVDFRAGEPIELGSFLAESRAEAGDEGLVRRLTYALLTRVERERRAVLGPASKPLDRVREEVLRSPKLQAVMRELAGEGEAERLVLQAKAYGLLRDMEAAPSVEGHRAFKIALDLVSSRIYGGIEVDEEGIERVREAAKRGTVVFLPSHKSHMDYVMLSNVLNEAHIQLPLIAAGDNLAFFPMGPLFRRGGAFFIRRSFKGDRLYAAVVDAYLRRLVREGYALEFFLEGGRSRSGKLLPPKMGLLGIVCDAALSLPHREVTFIPVSIGYERLLEERSYVREMSGGEKSKESARSLLRGTKTLGGFYGRVNVQFGDTLTLDQVRDDLQIKAHAPIEEEQKRALITRLAHRVMAEINRVTSVTPGALVATALLEGGRRGIGESELEASCSRLVGWLGRQGARRSASLVQTGGGLRPGAIREAAQIFVRAELCEEKVPGEDLGRSFAGGDVIYAVPDDRRLVLSMAKNSIVHFFVSPSLVALGLLGVERGEVEFHSLREGAPATEALFGKGAPGVTLDRLRERVRALSRLFKFEFMFRADAGFDRLFAETIAGMKDEGFLVESRPGVVAPGPGRDGLDGASWVRLLADLLLPYLLGYAVAARSLALLLKGPLPRRDLVKRGLVVGERMFLSGELPRREAISRPILENALLALEDQRYLTVEQNKVALTSSFASPATVGLVEAKIRAFLPADGGRP
jgi:glycerol-3-phosphate O-acyltransferase